MDSSSVILDILPSRDPSSYNKKQVGQEGNLPVLLYKPELHRLKIVQQQCPQDHKYWNEERRTCMDPTRSFPSTRSIP